MIGIIAKPSGISGGVEFDVQNLIDNLYVEVVNVLNDMHASGVDKVIYLGYYYPKNALLWLDDVEEAVDYGDMRLAQACRNSAANCTFIDPVQKSTIEISSSMVFTQPPVGPENSPIWSGRSCNPIYNNVPQPAWFNQRAELQLIWNGCNEEVVLSGRD